jgi:hypothetical protein
MPTETNKTTTKTLRDNTGSNGKKQFCNIETNKSSPVSNFVLCKKQFTNNNEATPKSPTFCKNIRPDYSSMSGKIPVVKLNDRTVDVY